MNVTFHLLKDKFCIASRFTIQVAISSSFITSKQNKPLQMFYFLWYQIWLNVVTLSTDQLNNMLD